MEIFSIQKEQLFFTFIMMNYQKHLLCEREQKIININEIIVIILVIYKVSFKAK